MKLFSPRTTGTAAGQLRGLSRYASKPLYTYPNRRTFTTPQSQPQPQKPADDSLSNQVRLLMRRVPYPVAIITATDPHASSSSSNDAYRGMTVSSFSTVTLHPEPIISFNVRRPSETLSALLSSRRFLVHLLAPGCATAALARDFSRGNRHHDTSVITGPDALFEYLPHSSLDGGAEAEGGGGVLPLLRRKSSPAPASAPGDSHSDPDPDPSRETPFVLECTLYPNQMEVYDHTIVLGRVVRTIAPQKQQQQQQQEQQQSGDDTSLCLTYADTRFWGMGSEIKDS